MLARRTYRRKHLGRADAVKIGGSGKVKGVTGDETLRRPLKSSKQQRSRTRLELQREYP